MRKRGADENAEPAKKEPDISMAISGNLPSDEKVVDGVRIVTTTNLHIQFVGPGSKVMDLVGQTAKKLIKPA